MWLDMNTCQISVLDVLHFTRKAFQKTTPERDFAVISCRLSGETVFTCHGEETYASPQDMVLIPAGVTYGQDSSEEEIVCVHLKIEGLQCDRILGFHCEALHLQQHFLRLHDIWQAREKGYLLKCKSMIFDILYELICLSEGEEADKVRPVIVPAVQYIREHYFEKDFSLFEAISVAYISPAYFRRIFKAVYGITPSSFVNGLRIDRAKGLLAGSMVAMQEIAEQCGFQNEKYFFLVFKKLVGATPSEWRRMHI